MLKKLTADSIKDNSFLRQNGEAQKQLFKFLNGLNAEFSDGQPQYIYNPGGGYSALWHMTRPIPPTLSMQRVIHFHSARTDNFELVNGNTQSSISIYFNYENLKREDAQRNAIFILVNHGLILFLPLNGTSYYLKCLSKQIHYEHFTVVTAYKLPKVSSNVPPTWGAKERLYMHELGDYGSNVSSLLNSLWFELTYLVHK